jgi:hypothetical protein
MTRRGFTTSHLNFLLWGGESKKKIYILLPLVNKSPQQGRLRNNFYILLLLVIVKRTTIFTFYCY